MKTECLSLIEELSFLLACKTHSIELTYFSREASHIANFTTTAQTGSINIIANYNYGVT